MKEEKKGDDLLAKYAISPEGATSLRDLAKNFDTCINGFKESNRTLQNILESLMDNLGIYGLEIWNITLKINSSLEDRNEDVELLKNNLIQQASAIEELFDFDGSSNSSGSNAGGGQDKGTSASKSGGKSESYNSVMKELKDSNVSFLEVSKNTKDLNSNEIASKLCGGDLTEGSCSSLALAYAGNRGGCDVIDFRGGDSCSVFSRRTTIKSIATLSGVKSVIESGKDDFKSTNSLIDKMELNKEYYLATGQHAAIVRKQNGRVDYLELQHPSDGNGWHLLNDDVLMRRFGCSDSHSVEFTSYLIDIESLSSSSEFLDILGFINTDPAAQRKGDKGHVK